MKIISTQSAFEKEIINISKLEPRYFYISTFGMKVDPFINQLLKNLPKNCDVKILIGVKDGSSKNKVEFLKKYFGRFKTKITDKLHTKILVSNKGCLIGGRNLTGSKWDDLNVKIMNKKSVAELKKYYINLYNKKKSL